MSSALKKNVEPLGGKNILRNKINNMCDKSAI